MSSRRNFRRPGRRGGGAILLGVLAVVVLAVFVGSALAPSHSDGRDGSVAAEGPAHVANPLAGRLHKVVGTDVSAARYGEEVAAQENFGVNLAGEQVSELAPIPAGRFARPVREYKAYAHGWIERTIRDAKALGATLSAGGPRAEARRAWEKAWGDYMHLGADYGLFGELEEELDGTAGGPRTSPSDPGFVGFRRLEWGLWTGRPPASLSRYAHRLVADLVRLRAALPGVEIDALDYATRGHEIIEDAQRDLMSGTDVPWSHQGVLGTAAALASVEEVFKTLKPLLSGRENTEGEVENWLIRLRGVFDGIRRDGRYPSLAQLGEAEQERLNGYVAGALGALQMVPSTLETEAYEAPPSIGGGR
jgi:hypothetical protein